MGPDEVKPENAPDIVTQLSERQRLRVEVIQDLMAAPDRASYRQRQQSAAERLDLSLSSVQRLVRVRWRDRLPYQEGNRGSRSLSPAQVAVRVKVRAQELGADHYPSHMSVYRLLNPLIEEA